MLEIFKFGEFFTYLRASHNFLNVTFSGGSWNRSCVPIIKYHLDEG